MERAEKRQLKRGAGVLMPISSLPNEFGIGSLGREAYEYADFVKEMGFAYWQVLPVGPTSFGDSPYQSFSAFAGNPYFISLDRLKEDGLLQEEELEEYQVESSDVIDYAQIYQTRFCILKKAFLRSTHYEMPEFKKFCEENTYWLDDYCLYMAVKNASFDQEWSLWEEDIKFRKPEAVKKYKKELEQEIEFYRFLQYEFRIQWNALKKYVNSLGIQMIGDIPLYVAMDSADVWVHPSLFELDKELKEVNIAGVPPDIFSKDGQRWGNPIYNWEHMEREDFNWWRRRMQASASLYDVIRIDHFIGIVNYWSIPAKDKTAVGGQWKMGPGEKLVKVINESIGNAKIIAEDLGVLTPAVKKVMKKAGYPGMKVLEFGLDGNPANEYLPHNYITNNIITYIGTHDNETLVGFLNGKKRKDISRLLTFFSIRKRADLPAAVIRCMFASISNVVMIQMQDLLFLDNKARMNYPSTLGGNWIWRMQKEQYPLIDTGYYKKLCHMYNR
ncbi:MAG: 4-alpha-glucanotransferase [Lachnospiraceae bacterium]|nr:4-alpha-glucanotransferase [Lachnospiraceae bacterium]